MNQKKIMMHERKISKYTSNIVEKKNLSRLT